MDIKVIGIDPAPGKQSTVYSEKDEDGFKSFYANELKKYLDEQKAPVLICWDAPLTGPRNPDAEQILPGDYTQRQIESFFKQQQGMKTPTGISVQGYASCPHWAITRALLGLPRVGPYDTPWQDLPFQLLASEEDKTQSAPPGKYVVEVHPAVALWLWLRPQDDYVYKPNKNTSKAKAKAKSLCFYRQLKKQFPQIKLPMTIANDDQLDALVAWLLGKLWVESHNEVILLGSMETGAMLLPQSEALMLKWKKFNCKLNKNTVKKDKKGVTI